MDNKQVVKRDDEQGLVTMSGGLMIPDMNKIDAFAEAVKTSIFAKEFEKKDPDDPEGKRKIVDKADIIANVVLGIEMGLQPAGALMLGKQLNKDAYHSVLRGRALKVDPITAITKIYVIEGKTSIAVDLISKAILDSGTIMTIVKDYEPTTIYVDAYTNAFVGYGDMIFNADGSTKDNLFIFDEALHDEEAVKTAKGSNKKIITDSGRTTNITTINFKRPSKTIDMNISYSIQEAIDGGLHIGFHSTMLDSKSKPLWQKGRDNWNKNPRVMLRNRTISIGGRIVVADIIQGGYSHDEVVDIYNTDHNTNYSNIKDVAVSEV